MKPKPLSCDRELLRQSLNEWLSEDQENELADHLSECAACQQELERLAAGNELLCLGDILRQEVERGGHGWAEDGSNVGFGSQLSGDDHMNSLADFAVDFLDPPTTPQTLGRLGDIDIEELIGHGSMGIVLKGFQKELNRPVAVKVLAPHLATSGAARKRFAREAQATAVIVHPNVMPILTVNSSGKLPYLVMPYTACESLQQRLDREGPLETIDILRIGMQVASGLAAAHAQGLVHRDIKPANILLEKGVHRAMLTDFGLARAVDDATLTRTGVIAGTPQFMSPEQVRGESVDARSDLFSLGSVLYAMCTGRPAFRAESSYGILRRITDTEPRTIHEVNREIPPWLCEIVEKLHSKNPAERFETAEDVADLLGRWLAHVQQPTGVPAPAAISRAKSHAPEAATTKRHVAIAACVAAVFVAAAGLFATIGLWMVLGWGQAGQADGVTQETLADEPDAVVADEVAPEEKALQDVLQGTWIAVRCQQGGKELQQPAVPSLIFEEDRLTFKQGRKSLEGLCRISSATDPMQLEMTMPGRGSLTMAFGLEPGKLTLCFDTTPNAPAPGKLETVEGDARMLLVLAPLLVRRFEGHTGPVGSVAFSPDGKLVASGSGYPKGDRSVRIWTASNGQEIRRIDTSADITEDSKHGPGELVGEVRSLVFSADGGQLLVGGGGGFVHLYDVASGKLVRRFEGCEETGGDQNTVHGVALSADGRLALAGGRAQRIIVWDAKSGDVLRRLEGVGWVRSLALSPDGRRALSGSFDGRVLLWDVESAEQLRRFRADGFVYGVAFSPDGRRAAAAVDIGEEAENMEPIHVWDLETGKQIHCIDAHRYAASGVVFSPDGRHILSGGHHWTMRLWDAETGKELHRSPKHPHWVRSVAFSPDGRFALSAGGSVWRAGKMLPGEDFAIRMWDLALATGKEKDDDTLD